MHLQGKPVCSFDPEGLIFAAGVNSEMVKLYDLRSFDKVREASVKFTFWNWQAILVHNFLGVVLKQAFSAIGLAMWVGLGHLNWFYQLIQIYSSGWCVLMKIDFIT